jgi:hypothetical protein
MTRDTVGKIAVDLMKQDAPTLDPIEIQREVHKEYEKNVFECINTHKSLFAGDFFVEVITKKERLLQNVLRNYYFATQACPSPTYDQTLYHYHRSSDYIEFLWVIPAKDICEMLTLNALDVVESERDLLNFVLEFNDGTLLRKAKKLNNECDDSPFLEK